jgi:hypothetical protein
MAMKSMRALLFGLFMMILAGAGVSGQVILKPFIGLESLPADTEAVCEIPWRIGGGFDTLGFNISDTVPDFTLYDPSGVAYNLRSQLETGKPVLLVTGSYTCPVFRNHIIELNELKNQFGELVSIFIIYTVEAHPDSDISPYYGYVNVSAQNFQEGILFGQSKTYGERKIMVDTMLKSMLISVPVLLDGPCNNFWNSFECGPNTAYLIRPDGVIFSKHGWFNQEPQNMTDDINLLLGNTVDPDSVTYNGHFTFEMTDDPEAQVAPGATAYLHGTIRNTDDANGVLVEIVKKSVLLPDDWMSSLCTDVCYSPAVDSAALYLAPNSSQVFTMDIYTSPVPDSGSVEVIFRNHAFPGEVFSQWFRTSTINDGSGSARIYPNPTNGSFLLQRSVGSADAALSIYNLQGELMMNATISDELTAFDISGYPAGIYFVRVGGQVIKLVKY